MNKNGLAVQTRYEDCNMILRRITANFRRQDWMAVGIELIVVVVGVFLGLQASNWNQERISNQQSAQFTARLKADLRMEDWGYQLMIEYSREVLVNANRAVGALDGSAPLPDEALLISAYRATQYKEQVLRYRSTYDELISTGTIGLIHDQVLRETANRLYNSVVLANVAREGLQSRYRAAFRMSLPNDVQRALSKHCGDHLIVPGDFATIHAVLDYPCATGLSAQTIAASVKALRTNPDILPDLRLRIADIETRLFDMTSNNRDIVEHLRAIAKEKP